MNKVGRRTKAWIAEKRKLIADLQKDSRYKVTGQKVEGTCPDCNHWHPLTPDHKVKRSAGGGHGKENIDWVCNEAPCFCHDKRDNQGDSLRKKPATGKKPAWMSTHPCKGCGRNTPMLICHNCHQLSA